MSKPSVFLSLCLCLLPHLAFSAPSVFKARCDSALTTHTTSGIVNSTDVIIRKGEMKKFTAPDGFQFEIRFGDDLARVDVLSVSAGGPNKMESTISYFTGDKFPRRFDLSVDSGFLTCVIR